MKENKTKCDCPFYPCSHLYEDKTEQIRDILFKFWKDYNVAHEISYADKRDEIIEETVDIIEALLSEQRQEIEKNNYIVPKDDEQIYGVEKFLSGKIQTK